MRVPQKNIITLPLSVDSMALTLKKQRDEIFVGI